jgi:hypothetical protein
MRGGSGLLPTAEIPGVQGYAKEVRGDEAELTGLNTDEADNDAIDRGHDPPVPEFLADEDCGDDRQNARDVIEAEHALSV